MSKEKLLILLILRITLSGLFIFSGYAKLFPIEAFEKQLVDIGISSWELAPYLSRSIIGFEIFLGLSFLQSSYLKKVIIPATALTLIAFCVHLTITIFTEGANSGNCGCFGQMLPMTPLQALLKNLATLGMLGYMYIIYIEKEKNFYAQLLIILQASLLIVFIKYPVKPFVTLDIPNDIVEFIDTSANITSDTTLAKNDSIISYDDNNTNTISNTEKVLNNTPIENKIKNSPIVKDSIKVEQPTQTGPAPKKSLFNSFKNFSNGTVVDLDKGKKLVSLFSLECEHCMETCKNIGILDKTTNIPEPYILFWGTQDQVANFFEKAECKYPYQIVDPAVFFPLLGNAPAPPRVVYLHNGNIISDWDFNTFSTDALKNAIKK